MARPRPDDFLRTSGRRAARAHGPLPRDLRLPFTTEFPLCRFHSLLSAGANPQPILGPLALAASVPLLRAKAPGSLILPPITTATAMTTITPALLNPSDTFPHRHIGPSEAEISEMLSAMFLTRNLRRFATYFDLETGTSRSLYCTPDQIESATRRKR